MTRVFISHSSEDRDFVEHEIVELLRRHGIDTWYSKADIPSARQWESEILRGLEACEWFLIAMSPSSVNSEWVKDELFWAINSRCDKIIPVLIGQPCDPGQFHVRLARIQHIDFSDDHDRARKALLSRFGVAFDDVRPNMSQLHVERASAYLKRGEYDSVLVECVAAIETDPSCFSAYLIRGTTHVLLKAYQKALMDFTEAIRLRPNLVNVSAVYCTRGEVHAATGKYQDAISDFTEAVRIDIRNTHAFHCRGISHAIDRHYDLAIADFSEVLKRNPRHGDALAHRGRCYACLGEHARAIQDLSIAIGLYPAIPDLRFYRGTTAFLAGRYPEAIADLDQAVHLAPNLASAYEIRANVYRAMGNEDLAARDLQQSRQLRQAGPVREPQSGLGIAPLSSHSCKELLREARERLDQRDLEGAGRCCEEAIQIDPLDAEGYFFRGMLLCVRGDHRAAIVQFNETVTRAPRHVDAYQFRAAARHAIGEYEGTINDANEMLAIDPQNAVGFRLRAMGHRGLGNTIFADRDDQVARRLTEASALPSGNQASGQ